MDFDFVVNFNLTASEYITNALIPYTFEGQINIQLLNDEKILAKLVDIDIVGISLGEITLNTANTYIASNKFNYTTDFYPSYWNETISYVLRGIWQRSTYYLNGHLFAGFSDSEHVLQKRVNVKVIKIHSFKLIKL